MCLQIPEASVQVIDDARLRDGKNQSWLSGDVAAAVAQNLHEQPVSMVCTLTSLVCWGGCSHMSDDHLCVQVVTFDEAGTHTGHVNHRATYQGVRWVTGHGKPHSTAPELTVAVHADCICSSAELANAVTQRIAHRACSWSR